MSPAEPSPAAIAVDDTHVYWTGGPLIGRSNLDGSAVIQCFITGTARPRGRGGRRPRAAPRAAPLKRAPPWQGEAQQEAGVGEAHGQGAAGPGELKLAKTGSVKGQHKRAEQSGKPKLSVKARGKAKKRLNKRGKAKVKAKVTYTPDGGTSDTKSKKIKLVKR